MKTLLVYIGIFSALVYQNVQNVEKNIAAYRVVENQRLTPLKLIQKHHLIKQGTVCFYPLEVKCIDGVCGEGRSYWEVSVNGDKVHYNANSSLKRSDRVYWKYVSLKGK